MILRPGTRLRPIGRVRAMSGATAWNPGDLSGTPREWLADPLYCFTDGSAAFAAASSQYLSVASNSGLQTGGASFWASCWVNLPSNTGDFAFMTKYGVDQYEWLVFHHNGTQNIRFVTYDKVAGTANSADVATPSAGSWVHVFVWYDSVANTNNLSINGNAPVTVTNTQTLTAGTAPLTLGAAGDSPNFPLNGNLASVAFGKSPPGGIAALATTIRDRLYASGNGIVYADTTAAERTAWGLVSWWDLVRSGVFTDSHGTNHLTNNNGVTFGAGLPRSRCGDTDPVAAWVDRFQGTTVSQSDPLKRPTLRLVSGKWVVRFDGVNDVLSAGDIEIITGTSMTAAARFSSSSVPRYACIVNKQYNATGYTLAGNWTASSTGKISFNAKSAAFAVSDSALDDGLYHTVIGVNDGTTSRMYVGNTLQAVTAAAGGSMPNTTDFVCLGGGGDAGGYGQYWSGDIASVVLNPSAPSDSERAALAAYLGGLS